MLKQGSSLLISRHGPALEHIIILQHNLNSPLPLTSLSLISDMQPHELAEMILYRMIAAPGISNIMLLEESIETVSGKISVKVVVDYSINENARRDIVYAFISNGFLYELRYSALKRYYFQDNIQAFQTVIRSFRLKE